MLRISIHRKFLVAASGIFLPFVLAVTNFFGLFDASQSVNLALLGLGALSWTIAGLVIPRNLSERVRLLEDTIRGVGRGEFDQTISVDSGDELEDLALRIDEMLIGLKRLFQLAIQDRELDIASAMLRNAQDLRVHEFPGLRVVPVQRLAPRVGGDWVDVRRKGATITVSVGEASGKGIGASLMAIVTMALFNSEWNHSDDLKEILARVNQNLIRTTDSASFTTGLWVSLDPTSGKATWINHGHPAPFLLQAHPDQGSSPGWFLEGPRNRALGWFENPGQAVTARQLAPGDRLFLYSDGLLESKSSVGELFGEKRLAECIVSKAELDSESIITETFQTLETFTSRRLDDDLTIAILEVTRK